MNRSGSLRNFSELGLSKLSSEMVDRFLNGDETKRDIQVMKKLSDEITSDMLVELRENLDSFASTNTEMRGSEFFHALSQSACPLPNLLVILNNIIHQKQRLRSFDASRLMLHCFQLAADGGDERSSARYFHSFMFQNILNLLSSWKKASKQSTTTATTIATKKTTSNDDDEDEEEEVPKKTNSKSSNNDINAETNRQLSFDEVTTQSDVNN
jgi:hypothetical protein